MKLLFVLCLFLVGCSENNTNQATLNTEEKYSIRQCIRASTGLLCRDSFLLDKTSPLEELDICFYMPYGTLKNTNINISCADYEKIKARGIKE